MVGDDPHRRVGLPRHRSRCRRWMPRPVAVFHAGNPAYVPDYIFYGIDVKYRVDLLDDASEPLQPHARVDVLLLQQGVVAVFVLVELCEHKIPELYEPVAVAARFTIRSAAPVCLAPVQMYLGTGTARTCAVLPEIILLAEFYDPAFRKSSFLPYIICLVIFQINGHPEFVLGQIQDVGYKLPCPADSLLLEIIAEREIAQHLEKRRMPRGDADVVDIHRPEAFLACGHPLRRRLLLPCEIRLHRRHAGIDEQHARIVPRHQREAGELIMRLALEEIQIHFSQFVQAVFVHSSNHRSNTFTTVVIII